MNDPFEEPIGEDVLLAAAVRDSVADVTLPAAFAARLAAAVADARRRRRRRAAALGAAALVLALAAGAALSAVRGGERAPAPTGVVARALPGGAAAPLVAGPLAGAREAARRRRRLFRFLRGNPSGDRRD